MFFFYKELTLLNEATGETMERRLPVTIDVQRLKFMVTKLFKSSELDMEAMRLFYKTSLVNPNTLVLNKNET